MIDTIMKQKEMIDMNIKGDDNKVKTIVAITVGTAFMAAVYYLPTEVFMSFFAAGLFMIPTAFFVYMIQKMAG